MYYSPRLIAPPTMICRRILVVSSVFNAIRAKRSHAFRRGKRGEVYGKTDTAGKIMVREDWRVGWQGCGEAFVFWPGFFFEPAHLGLALIRDVRAGSSKRHSSCNKSGSL